MNLPLSTTDEQDSDYFRCPIINGQNDATIRIGRRQVKASVQETSIDGFTITVPKKYASKLKVGKTWVLDHEGAKTEVHPLWFFNMPDGNVQMGLRRLEDVTPRANDNNSLLIRFGGARFQDPSFSATLYGGIILSLICLLALPGWGDQMGTSERIHDVVLWLLDGLDDTFGSYL